MLWWFDCHSVLVLVYGKLSTGPARRNAIIQLTHDWQVFIINALSIINYWSCSPNVLQCPPIFAMRCQFLNLVIAVLHIMNSMKSTPDFNFNVQLSVGHTLIPWYLYPWFRINWCSIIQRMSHDKLNSIAQAMWPGPMCSSPENCQYYSRKVSAIIQYNLQFIAHSMLLSNLSFYLLCLTV